MRKLALALTLLTVVSLPVSAEELQVTVTGLACTLAPVDCQPGTYTTPFTITYDVDTRSGHQTFRVGEASFGIEGEVLVNYEASNLAITDYSASLGGLSLAFAAWPSGHFGFDVEGRDSYDFAGGASPSPGGFFFDSFATPIVTAPEFATFQDPLASLLLKFRSTPGSCGFCQLNGSDFTDYVPLIGTMTVTPVPSPGPLLLLLAGLVGIALSRLGKAFS